MAAIRRANFRRLHRMVGRSLLIPILGLVGSGCAPSVPDLVRDGAGYFSGEARLEAESRLQSLADLHGIWTFIISEPGGDPPRMLDAPMGEADAAGVRAVAILLNEHGLVGAGYSRAFDDRFMGGFAPPSVELAAGDRDAALEALVRYLEEWAADPPVLEPGGPPLEQPSGGP
jgi:hypothetical protein